MWSHLYVLSKTKQSKAKYEQTNWVHGYREQIAGYQRWGGEVGGSVESGWSAWRGLKSGNPVIKQISCRYIIYNLGTIANNTVLYIWKLL